MRPEYWEEGEKKMFGIEIISCMILGDKAYVAYDSIQKR